MGTDNNASLLTFVVLEIFSIKMAYFHRHEIGLLLF